MPQSLFFIKLQVGLRSVTLLKKELWHRCFPLNFAKFLKTPFLQNTTRRLLLENKSYNSRPLLQSLVALNAYWINLFRNLMCKFRNGKTPVGFTCITKKLTEKSFCLKKYSSKVAKYEIPELIEVRS